MFDIAWSEIMVIAVVALVVVGPKDLPKVIYQMGKWVRKARMMAREFQTHVDDMMREAEMDDLRAQALKARDMNLQTLAERSIDPDGGLRNAFDLAATGAAGHPGSPAETAPEPALAPVPLAVPDPAAPAPAPESVAASPAAPLAVSSDKTA